MIRQTTIAEEHYARTIAFWHGSQMVVNNQTVAAMKGYTGWAWGLEKYVNNHWREYLGAARAIIEDK